MKKQFTIFFRYVAYGSAITLNEISIHNSIEAAESAIANLVAKEPDKIFYIIPTYSKA